MVLLMRRLPYTWFQRVVLILSAAMVVVMLLYTIINYRSFPDRVPTHFGISGEADAWGDKSSVWFMPGLSAAIFVVMAVVSYFPACWNVRASVNERNIGFVYVQTKNMLCTMNFGITLLFSYFYACTVKAAPLHRWTMPAVLAVFVGGTLIWVIYIWKRAKTI